MAENTFIGSGTKKNLVRVAKDIYGGNEFMSLGEGIFDSEKLTNSVYEIYLSLIAKGFQGNGLTPETIVQTYSSGFYLPCVKRVVFSGQVDLLNDSLPESAGLVMTEDSNKYSEGPLFVSAQKIKRFPRGYASAAAGCFYKLIWAFKDDGIENRRERVSKDFDMRFVTNYFCVKNDGVIVPAIQCGEAWEGHQSGIIKGFGATLSATLNANADSRFLWNVRTEESAGFGRLKTPLLLGVSEEHVKSLFYARSLPVTESGRKKPILHWVRAHERRMKGGIDIDVSKHLRGISEMEMDGFRFSITNPTKKSKEDAA